MTGQSSQALEHVMAQQRARRVLGPDSVQELRAHSLGFARAVGEVPGRALDLGSGAGVPGLFLAEEAWPTTALVLIDASERRCTYLELATAELGLTNRVEVRWGRAEVLARTDLRECMDVVVARSFGPPAVTAECGAPFLRVGGLLVVSDPPGGRADRWVAGPLASLGLVREGGVECAGAAFSRLRLVAACPAGYPRRTGLPRSRPLF